MLNCIIQTYGDKPVIDAKVIGGDDFKMSDGNAANGASDNDLEAQVKKLKNEKDFIQSQLDKYKVLSLPYFCL